MKKTINPNNKKLGIPGIQILPLIIFLYIMTPFLNDFVPATCNLLLHTVRTNNRTLQNLKKFEIWTLILNVSVSKWSGCDIEVPR